MPDISHTYGNILGREDLSKGINNHKSHEILPYIPNYRTIAADYSKGYEKLRFPSRMRENKSMAILDQQDKDDRSHKFSFASYVSISSDKFDKSCLKIDKPAKLGKYFLITLIR